MENSSIIANIINVSKSKNYLHRPRATASRRLISVAIRCTVTNPRQAACTNSTTDILRKRRRALYARTVPIPASAARS